MRPGFGRPGVVVTSDAVQPSVSQERGGSRDRTSVTEEAIEKIKAMIVSGQLGPGDRLPREDELAASLGLSRSSLREAVRALSLVRILDVRQGDGTYVTSLKPELLLEAVSFVIDFHRDDSVLHFLEVRRIIEPAATAMAALRVTPADVARLDNLVASAGADATGEDFLEVDRRFHREVVALCDNPVLLSLLESIAGPTHRARVWRGAVEFNAGQRTISEHRGILEAMARHQPDVAAARATAHIAGLEDWVRRAALAGGHGAAG